MGADEPTKHVLKYKASQQRNPGHRKWGQMNQQNMCRNTKLRNEEILGTVNGGR
jgi:hypothetical protein